MQDVVYCVTRRPCTRPWLTPGKSKALTVVGLTRCGQLQMRRGVWNPESGAAALLPLNGRGKDEIKPLTDTQLTAWLVGVEASEGWVRSPAAAAAVQKELGLTRAQRLCGLCDMPSTCDADVPVPAYVANAGSFKDVVLARHVVMTEWGDTGRPEHQPPPPPAPQPERTFVPWHELRQTLTSSTLGLTV